MNNAQNKGDKFEREWLQAKPQAITNYNAVASTLAAKSSRRIRAMRDFCIEAIQSGKWEQKLSKYVGNDLMANAYKQKLDNITVITQASKERVANTVDKKQQLMSRVGEYLDAYRTSSFYYVRFPSGVTEKGLRNTVGLAVMINLKILEPTFNSLAIAFFIQETLIQHFGWPFDAQQRGSRN